MVLEVSFKPCFHILEQNLKNILTRKTEFFILRVGIIKILVQVEFRELGIEPIQLTGPKKQALKKSANFETKN